MRIAVDVNVSNREIGELTREGDLVVCTARPREEDWRWLERALEKDADIIISQDLDIPNLLDHWRVSDDVLYFKTINSYREWRGKNVQFKQKATTQKK